MGFKLHVCDVEVTFWEGKCVHKQMGKHNRYCNIFVGNSLIDQHAKYGSKKNVWKAIVLAKFAIHKFSKNLLLTLTRHQKVLTRCVFCPLLWACIHVCFVVEGSHFFDCMDFILKFLTIMKHDVTLNFLIWIDLP